MEHHKVSCFSISGVRIPISYRIAPVCCLYNHARSSTKDYKLPFFCGMTEKCLSFLTRVQPIDLFKICPTAGTERQFLPVCPPSPDPLLDLKASFRRPNRHVPCSSLATSPNCHVSCPSPSSPTTSPNSHVSHSPPPFSASTPNRRQHGIPSTAQGNTHTATATAHLRACYAPSSPSVRDTAQAAAVGPPSVFHGGNTATAPSELVAELVSELSSSQRHEPLACLTNLPIGMISLRRWDGEAHAPSLDAVTSTSPVTDAEDGALDRDSQAQRQAYEAYVQDLLWAEEAWSGVPPLGRPVSTSPVSEHDTPTSSKRLAKQSNSGNCSAAQGEKSTLPRYVCRLCVPPMSPESCCCLRELRHCEMTHHSSTSCCATEQYRVRNARAQFWKGLDRLFGKKRSTKPRRRSVLRPKLHPIFKTQAVETLYPRPLTQLHLPVESSRRLLFFSKKTRRDEAEAETNVPCNKAAGLAPPAASPTTPDASTPARLSRRRPPALHLPVPIAFPAFLSGLPGPGVAATTAVAPGPGDVALGNRVLRPGADMRARAVSSAFAAVDPGKHFLAPTSIGSVSRGGVGGVDVSGGGVSGGGENSSDTGDGGLPGGTHKTSLRVPVPSLSHLSPILPESSMSAATFSSSRPNPLSLPVSPPRSIPLPRPHAADVSQRQEDEPLFCSPNSPDGGGHRTPPSVFLVDDVGHFPWSYPLGLPFADPCVVESHSPTSRHAPGLQQLPMPHDVGVTGSSLSTEDTAATAGALSAPLSTPSSSRSAHWPPETPHPGLDPSTTPSSDGSDKLVSAALEFHALEPLPDTEPVVPAYDEPLTPFLRPSYDLTLEEDQATDLDYLSASHPFSSYAHPTSQPPPPPPPPPSVLSSGRTVAPDRNKATNTRRSSSATSSALCSSQSITRMASTSPLASGVNETSPPSSAVRQLFPASSRTTETRATLSMPSQGPETLLHRSQMPQVPDSDPLEFITSHPDSERS
eukprot:Rmarinus@m.14812